MGAFRVTANAQNGGNAAFFYVQGNLERGAFNVFERAFFSLHQKKRMDLIENDKTRRRVDA